MKRKYICYCCGYKTDKWYVNSKTGRRNKYCTECLESYTPDERKEKEIAFVFDILKDVIIE